MGTFTEILLKVCNSNSKQMPSASEFISLNGPKVAQNKIQFLSEENGF